MHNYSKDGITAIVMLDTRRKTKENLYPIKIRITHKRKVVYKLTGISSSENDWELLPKAKSKEANALKKDLKLLFGRVTQVINDLIERDMFSLASLKVGLGKEGNFTLNATYQDKIDTLVKEGKHNTADWYKYSLRAVKMYAGENIKHSFVTVDFLKKFEASMLSDGKSYTTISMYMRALQSIMNIAKHEGLIKASQYPFGKNKYEIPQHSGRAMALTLKRVGEIFRYDRMNEKQKFFRDLWLFSYLCNGLNMVDLCQLRYKDIHDGKVSFYRQKVIAKAKVKKKIIAIVLPEMEQIIAAHGNKKESPDTLIFPILDGTETPLEQRDKVKAATRSLNHYMGKIGKALGIGNITSYTARHSYATVLKRSGSNIAYISEALGHTDIKTTESYLANFEEEEMEKNAKILTSY